MSYVLAALIVAGSIPIGLALWANRRTSLAHALGWALIGWLSWGVAFLLADFDAARYCALCLTGCAGVAVLGARRPHVFAWNFVVAGLFAVMMLPIFEAQLIGTRFVDGLCVAFLASTIAVSVVNYLPTRLAPAAVLLAIVCAGAITALVAPARLPAPDVGLICDLLLTAVPWIAWSSVRRGDAGRSAFDRLWLSFRDRWGLVWSQRVREQFNNAAQHSGWPIKLMWRGLAPEGDTPKMVETLRAILQRFL